MVCRARIPIGIGCAAGCIRGGVIHGSHLDHCPKCGVPSPRGIRNTLLKIFSIVVFLASLASVAGASISIR